MKKLLLIPLMCILLIMGCQQGYTPPTADQVEQHKQEALTSQASAQVGMPALPNFVEKQRMRWLLELRDNPRLINYLYLQAEYTGKLILIGKCIGYPIPYSTQFSNPQKLVEPDHWGTGVYTEIPMSQAEPNGLFMPASADGTWVIMVDPHGGKDPQACYFEPKVTVLPFLITM